jgi:hypothetical protein
LAFALLEVLASEGPTGSSKSKVGSVSLKEGEGERGMKELLTSPGEGCLKLKRRGSPGEEQALGFILRLVGSEGPTRELGMADSSVSLGAALSEEGFFGKSLEADLGGVS